MEKLLKSDFPLNSFGINSGTGVLDIEVDTDRTSENLDEELQEFVGENVPINVTYDAYDASFQGYCSGQSGDCTTIIGASKGENGNNGLDCTINIASTKTVRGTTIDGVIIPHHCNTGYDDYYQNDKNDFTEKVGRHHTTGDWYGHYCDCDFIENTSSRSTNDSTLNYNGNNLPVGSRADLAVGDSVYMIGQYSGLDFGTIAEVNKTQFVGGKYLTNLYYVTGINFDSGDSGAPVVKSSGTVYGGMNVGAGTETINGQSTSVNYAHDWTYLKSSMGLN